MKELKMASSKKPPSKIPEPEKKGNKPNQNKKGHKEESKLLITELEKEGREDVPMSPVKQATLINCHLAIEDDVDVDSIWNDMQSVFNDNEQEEIQTQGTKKAEMKKLLDLLPSKSDHAFDVLVTALRPKYKWLSQRLQQGMTEEEARIKKLGKGIRQKIALSLLTARISERQKDGILERVTSVVEAEITEKAMRVSIPDHRAAAQLDAEHKALHELIQKEVDPLLYGREPTPSRNDEDYDNAIDELKFKLEELQTLKDCYVILKLGNSSSSNLPSQLVQKIEELKTRITILEQEKREALSEIARMIHEKAEQQRSLARLQQHNRNLEIQNRALESERQWMEQAARKNQEGKKEVERECQKALTENYTLKSELQLSQDRLSDFTLRNRSLDDQNTKLTRENVRLAATNTKLRKNARNNIDDVLAEVRSENKRLTSERTQLKKEIQKLDSERRKLLVRSQKLEAENLNLREQKRKLLQERKRSQQENKALKNEAKRLALGKYRPLPPISERREQEDHNNGIQSSATSPENGQPVKKPARATEQSPSRHQARLEKPWSKYKEQKSTLPKGKADTVQEKNKALQQKEAAENRKKIPGYMKSTASSQKHYYLTEEDKMVTTSRKRPVSWK